MSKNNPGLWLLLAFGAGLMGGLIGSWLGSPSPAVAGNQRVLEAEELRLTDPSGRTRLFLTLVRGKPRLFMLDEAGEYRLEMGLGDGGEPHLWLRDREGAAKVQVSLSASGRPAFRLVDHQDRERAILGLSEGGDPTMILRDDKGKDRLALWQDPDEAGLALADSQGRPIATFSTQGREPASLSFFTESGQLYRIID